MNKQANPLPWRLDSVKTKDGYRRLSIVDANGLAIANMVMDPRDNERVNGRLIVDAVNATASAQASLISPETHCQCLACKVTPHWSDCAVHNAPALEPGPCDCGAVTESLENT